MLQWKTKKRAMMILRNMDKNQQKRARGFKKEEKTGTSFAFFSFLHLLNRSQPMILEIVSN